MHLHTRNVNTAFQLLVQGFMGDMIEDDRFPIVKRPSRNGDVLMIDEPVTITYSHPRERVLFNAARDANPFFHLYEAMWMLAGRKDVASVTHYAKQMAQYSDNGRTLNGAYGYRWRHAETVMHRRRVERDLYANSAREVSYVDQLDLLVAHLKADPTSRRAVLQMWNVEDDLLKIGQPNPRGEIGAYRIGDKVVASDASKDVCCNLSVMFSIRDDQRKAATCAAAIECQHGYDVCPICDRYIDMTVTNRSNDLIWGLLGANYVHFTFLQEYLAARLGVEVGKYHHFSNNLHAYSWNWHPEKWLECEQGEAQRRYHSDLELVRLIESPEQFEKELPSFVDNNKAGLAYNFHYDEPFFEHTAQPMMDAHRLYKAGDGAAALAVCGNIRADDWRITCQEWLKRRVK